MLIQFLVFVYFFFLLPKCFLQVRYFCPIDWACANHGVCCSVKASGCCALFCLDVSFVCSLPHVHACFATPHNWMCWRHNDVGAEAGGGGAWSRTPPCTPRWERSGFWGAALANSVQRCQGAGEEEVMRCHSAPLLSALSETLLTV